RTQLKPIKNKQKYLYFYSKNKKDLALLLHRYDKYYLYSLYHPKQSPVVIHANKKMRYKDIEKILRKKGYKVTTPFAVAATSKVALRRYKGIKTLLVEIKDYSALQTKYKTAIKTYDAQKVKHIKTKLPHAFIDNYYKQYATKASTQEQREQLSIIAKKLNLDEPETNVIDEEKEVQEALAKEIPEEIEEPSILQTSVPFDYYAQEASYHELDTYLTKKETRDTLSFNQYTQLKQRHSMLHEEKILKEGSLEELISLYKTNKNPKYKKRILELMKEAQE
ncbi:hypothetical protein C9926_01805, partial [Sulfurovum lithotrophicum]